MASFAVRLCAMKGTLIRAAAGTLDKLSAALGNGRDIPAHLATGIAGEEAAYFYLRTLGYTAVARNWRVPQCKGELDLVAWDGAVLCFVEVKTRSTRDVKPAEAAVDERKRRELAATARCFLRRLKRRPREWCFDVVSVYCPKTAPVEFTLFKNAFSVP